MKHPNKPWLDDPDVFERTSELYRAQVRHRNGETYHGTLGAVDALCAAVWAAARRAPGSPQPHADTQP